MRKNIYIFIILSLSTSLAMGNSEDLYVQNCLVCHGDDGAGAMPGVSDLTDNRKWAELADQKLLEKLNNGISPKGAAVSMPPKGGNPNLTDKELLGIIEYMKKEFVK